MTRQLTKQPTGQRTRQEAIREETLRYVNACAEVVNFRNDPAAAEVARRIAHIHLLALGRLRGQTVAPWIHQADLYLPCGCHIETGGCPICCGGLT
jgi:hypothetical protein